MKHRPSPLFKSLVQSLFLHGTIETSEAKAKAIKGLIDKIINLAKSKSRKHLLQSYLVDKNLRERLIKEIVPRLGDRTSGYASLIRLGPRLGDTTMMVRINLLMEKVPEEVKKPIRKKVSKK